MGVRHFFWVGKKKDGGSEFRVINLAKDRKFLHSHRQNFYFFCQTESFGNV